MTPDINKLKLCVARMLPDHIHFYAAPVYGNAGKLLGTTLVPKWEDTHTPVTDREWLHACWLVEQTLTVHQGESYCEILKDVCGCDVDAGKASRVCYFASAEQRLEALCRVKCPEIFTPSYSASQT